MKRFLLNGLVFVLLAAVVVTGGVWGLWIANALKKHHLMMPKPGNQVLALGDSHVGMSFVEEHGIRVLYHAGNSLGVSWIKLKEFERNGGMDEIKAVVMNFCYTSISVDLSEMHQRRNFKSMIPYLFRHWDEIPFRGVEMAKFALSIVKYAVVDATRPPIGGNTQNRHGMNEVSWAERDRHFTENDANRSVENHFGADMAGRAMAGSDEYLLKLVKRYKAYCDERGIKLIFFSAPLPRQYRERVPAWAEAKIKEWAGRFRELGIPYYDYMDSCPTDAYFFDADHLNYDGARWFTEKFYSEVLKDILKAPAATATAP